MSKLTIYTADDETFEECRRIAEENGDELVDRRTRWAKVRERMGGIGWSLLFLYWAIAHYCDVQWALGLVSTCGCGS